MNKQHKIEKPDVLLKKKVSLFEFRLSRDKFKLLNLISSMNILLAKFISQFFVLRSSCFSLAVLLCFLVNNILYDI